MLLTDQCLDGRYRLVEPLSNGGFGETWIAEDTKRPGHPRCVVKHLTLYDKREEVMQRVRVCFRDEAVVLERLGEHDQIPRLLAYFEENGEFYLIQELIHGHPLTQELAPGQSFSESEVMFLLTEVLNILKFVHGQGVIHRDIKPANLMRRDRDRKIVLIDFGAVKQVITALDASGHSTIAIGTADYMPIEQFQGHPQFNSDLYALGLVALQALTGLDAASLRKQRDPRTGKFQNAALLNSNGVPVEPNLMTILSRMTHPDYRQRYQSASDVLGDLHRCMKPNQTPVPTTILPSSSNRQAQGVTALEGSGLPAVTEIDSVSRSQPKARSSLSINKRRWIPAVAAIGILGGLFGGNQWRIARARELFNQGAVQFEADDYRGAIDKLNQSLFLNPQDGWTYLERGRAYVGLRDSQSAASNYEQAINHLDSNSAIGGIGAPIDIDSQTHTPMVVKVRDGLAAAQSGIKPGDRILTIDGQSTENLSFQDIYRRLSGQPDQPVTLQISRSGSPNLTVVVKRSAVPNSVLGQAYSGRSLARVSLGDYKGAIDDANHGLQIDPQNSSFYLARAQALSKSGNKTEAIRDFTQAINAQPSANLYLERGSAYLFLQQYDAAVDDFTQAIRLEPNNDFAYYQRALTYGAQKNYQAELSDADRAIALNPKTLSGYLARSGALVKMGNYQEALDTLNRALSIDPNVSEAYLDRGLVREKLDDRTGAIEDYTQALRIDPKSADIYINRGKLRASNTDLQGAIEDFSKAIDLQSNSADAYFDRGLVYRVQKNNSAAINDFQQAAKFYLEQKRSSDYNRALAALKSLQSS